MAVKPAPQRESRTTRSINKVGTHRNVFLFIGSFAKIEAVVGIVEICVMRFDVRLQRLRSLIFLLRELSLSNIIRLRVSSDRWYRECSKSWLRLSRLSFSVIGNSLSKSIACDKKSETKVFLIQMSYEINNFTTS